MYKGRESFSPLKPTQTNEYSSIRLDQQGPDDNRGGRSVPGYLVVLRELSLRGYEQRAVGELPSIEGYLLRPRLSGRSNGRADG